MYFQNNCYKRHCLRSMPKVSNKIKFKRNALGEFFVIRKKLFYVKMIFLFTETFFDVIFYIFDKWRRVQKKYYVNHEKFWCFKLLVKISTGSLFAENLPVTESLSRRILQKISFFLIFCIPVIRCSKLFFRLSRGKLVDVSLLKQFKTLLDILMSLNDGFHDLYNEQNWWTESKIQNSVHAKAV